MTEKRAKVGNSRKVAAQRRLLFVDAYLANGQNATQAAITVGYAPKSAYVRGYELVKNSQVQVLIEKRRAVLRAKFGLTTDRVLLELGRVNYFDPRKVVDENGKAIPLHLLDEDTAAALAAIEITETSVTGEGEDKVTTTKVIKAKPYNKVSSLEMSVKLLRLYDAPPPAPVDERREVDMGAVALRIAFILERNAHEVDKAAQPKLLPAKKKLQIPT